MKNIIQGAWDAFTDMTAEIFCNLEQEITEGNTQEWDERNYHPRVEQNKQTATRIPTQQDQFNYWDVY